MTATPAATAGSEAANTAKADAPTVDVRLAARAWESLFRAQATLLRGFADDDIWNPVSLREYDVLFTLSQGPKEGMRLVDLNCQVFLSQPALSRLVERMEKNGLVTRDPDPADGRAIIIRFTPEGRRIQKEVGSRHVRQIASALSPALDDDQLRQLAEICDALVAGQPRR